MEKIEATVRRLAFDVGLRTAFAAVYVEVPFLGFPVVRQVFEFCITRFMDVVFTELSLGVLGMVIDIKTTAERVAYETATNELKSQLQKAEKNVEALTAAQEQFKKQLAALIRLPR